MRKFYGRIAICLIPLLISAYIVGMAFVNYFQGRGGFKLGVDLVGGTILIYEVDPDRLPPGWNASEAASLASRLKSRIDPGDIYNVTIRVAGTNRFEIILPTGGEYQREAQRRHWDKLIEDVEKFDQGEFKIQKYVVPVGQPIELLAAVNAQEPDTGKDASEKKEYWQKLKKTILKDAGVSLKDEPGWITDSQFSTALEAKLNAEKTDQEKKKFWDSLLAKVGEDYPLKTYVVGPGRDAELATEIFQQHPKANLNTIRRMIRLLEQNPNISDEKLKEELNKEEQGQTGPRRFGRRGQSMTTEQVQELKELIAAQGSLEFVILASSQHDKEAFDAVQKFFDRVRTSEPLKKYLQELALQGKPPPITVDENDRPQDPVFAGHRYRWVEMGQLYRFEHGFANPRDPKTGALLKPPPEPGEPNYQENLKAWNDNETNKKLWEAALRTPQCRMWERAAQARAEGRLLPYDTGPLTLLIDSRRDQNIRPTERDRDKEFDYFLLCRLNKEGTPPITGNDVASASPGQREEVYFRMKPWAGARFHEFTEANKDQMMAIVLDGYIQSAATIQSAISTEGRITNMGSQDRIDAVVKILRSGPLQASLRPDPVSENTLGPTLGADTIKWGFFSVLGAFVAVLVFMLFYYRFAGLVACVALLANLLLTVAFMVAIDATFTLPGLAGLVLMLGMAVDANVLIYERLREEGDRGASIGQALRNGYEHAFPTIIDTHLSSIFTAIVLYVVGNDQLKGFGISLTVGLLISLFTSLYMTRTMFDLWLARGWLHKLSMASFKHWPGLRAIFGRDINFMAIRYQVFTATAIVTLLGAILFIYRLDRGGLNIDFMGGIAYSAELTEPLSLEQLRSLLNEKETGLKGLTVEQTFVTGYSGVNDKGETTSRLFTIRAETPPEYKNDTDKYLKKVQQIIKDHLVLDGKELLKTINMSDYEIMPDHREVYLSFVDPETRLPVFASRAQVSMLLTQELKDNHLEALAQQMNVMGVGLEREGRFQWMKVLFPIQVKDAELYRLEAALKATQVAFKDNPQPERLEKFDSQLAADTQVRALAAIIASWCAILLYLWFRFGNWTFGLAAVLCLIHDLFFTLGVIAASHYFYEWFPAVATSPIFQISDFKIDLPTVAALLTLVGYSVNDTIVVFDRIREVRGKNPSLTPKMINDAINQTLSRTILASMSVFLVVVVLYYFGGEGVHLFAFVMVVGVIVGTLSSIYVASPLLLLFGEGRTGVSERDRVSTQSAESAMRTSPVLVACGLGTCQATSGWSPPPGLPGRSAGLTTRRLARRSLPAGRQTCAPPGQAGRGRPAPQAAGTLIQILCDRPKYGRGCRRKGTSRGSDGPIPLR